MYSEPLPPQVCIPVHSSVLDKRDCMSFLAQNCFLLMSIWTGVCAFRTRALLRLVCNSPVLANEQSHLHWRECSSLDIIHLRLQLQPSSWQSTWGRINVLTKVPASRMLFCSFPHPFHLLCLFLPSVPPALAPVRSLGLVNAFSSPTPSSPRGSET